MQTVNYQRLVLNYHERARKTSQNSIFTDSTDDQTSFYQREHKEWQINQIVQPISNKQQKQNKHIKGENQSKSIFFTNKWSYVNKECYEYQQINLEHEESPNQYYGANLNWKYCSQKQKINGRTNQQVGCQSYSYQSSPSTQSHPLPPSNLSIKYKTQLCKNFSETGHCAYRHRCKFAHGIQQLNLQNLNECHNKHYRTKKCNSFWNEGRCSYGQRCQFSHYENLNEKNRKKDVLRWYYEYIYHQTFKYVNDEMEGCLNVRLCGQNLEEKYIGYGEGKNYDQRENCKLISANRSRLMKILYL